MTPGAVATSSVVLGNLIYVIGAVVAFVVLSLVVVLRQRKPKSVEANMESFHRGLRALAPNPTSAQRSTVASTARATVATRVESRRPQVQAVTDADAAPEPEETGAG